MPPRRAHPEATLGRALDERHVLVVCGSGGVGKTTTSAALALHAACSGRRVLVCTIDPSRRLATSLGLGRLSGRPRVIDVSRLGADVGPGSLHAMVLDVKSTFDDLVARHTPDEAARRRILGNRFYRQVSAALAGSHEYMAMEKLLELAADTRWDLVVLDTPPTRHALDFLEAPDRLMDFLDTGVLRWFLKPYFAAGKLTLRVASRTGAVALKLADRFLGLEFLQDLSEFFLAFESMYDGFKERATRVHALLREGSSGFVLVAAPAPLALEEALYFHRRLTEKEMPFLAFIVNRVHPAAGRSTGRGRRHRLVPPPLASKLVETFREQQTLAGVEQRAVARLEVDTREKPILVPEFEQDIHDLQGLAAFADTVLPGTGTKVAGRRAGAR
ncbi:MAG: AAA family ATPase [Acidobacteria bacterium]|jgi:anion-transporting  ArsA/GET3 family ATPase|nr:AAA family ATPase [Acidobacteriota bacterium]